MLNSRSPGGSEKAKGNQKRNISFSLRVSNVISKYCGFCLSNAHGLQGEHEVMRTRPGQWPGVRLHSREVMYTITATECCAYFIAFLPTTALVKSRMFRNCKVQNNLCEQRLGLYFSDSLNCGIYRLCLLLCAGPFLKPISFPVIFFSPMHCPFIFLSFSFHVPFSCHRICVYRNYVSYAFMPVRSTLLFFSPVGIQNELQDESDRRLDTSQSIKSIIQPKGLHCEALKRLAKNVRQTAIRETNLAGMKMEKGYKIWMKIQRKQS